MRISWILVFIFYTLPSFAATPVAVNSLWQNDSPAEEIILPEKQTKLAIFERNGYAYIIAQNETNFDFLPNKKWAVIPHPLALILRTPIKDRKINIGKGENDLRILLGNGTKNDITSLLTLKAETGNLLIELPQTEIISFQDPNTKENIIALPVNYSPFFVSKEYKNPEVIFTPTLLGIAIIDKTGKTKLTPIKNGYLWTPLNKASLTLPTQSSNFFSYQKMPFDTWLEQINRIKTFIPFSDTKLKEKLHTELALLYLSKGFNQKALEITDMLKNETLFDTIKNLTKKEENLATNPYTQQRFYFNLAKEIETKDTTQAKEFYQKAYDIIPTSSFGAQSLAKLTYIALNEKTIDETTAILAFEKLRILLGDKEQRIQLFKTLSDLYEKKGLPLKALDNKRELLLLSKDEKLIQEIRQEFERFFNQEHTPQERILAYYRFQELMPIGKDGFKIKNQLINDYIELDLLQQAYNLTMQTASEQDTILAQQEYIKAGLIAQLMQDKEKAQKAFNLSQLKQINDFSFITYFHPLLQEEWLKIKP